MLENMVKKYNLSEKVKFTGFVSEPEKLWLDCDVFCFPIRWQEPFGLVGLEAMANGIPVVAFDRGGVREWMSDTRSGIAVPEDGKLETAFSLLAENPEKLISMGEYSKKIAEEKFSERSFLEKFSSLLRENSI
jgi:glycosyltransferase involved in cell wall biosynthesis